MYFNILIIFKLLNFKFENIKFEKNEISGFL